MPRSNLFPLLLLLLLTPSSAVAQEFANINFELASPNPPYILSDWTPSPYFAGPTLSEAHLLYPSPTPAEWKLPFPFPSTNYSVTMQVGQAIDNQSQLVVSAPSISQAGLIPVQAKSIRLRATSPDPYFLHTNSSPPLPPSDPNVYAPGLLVWHLEVDGRPYPLYRLDDDFWGINIPGQAGQVRTLSITTNEAYIAPGLSWPVSIFDDLHFSTQRIIPEPHAATLAQLALVAFAAGRRARRK
jgi:hypothetical protein